MIPCPCCGYILGKRDPVEVGKLLRLTTGERAAYDAFARRFGQMITAQQLADAIYADDPNGGPDNAKNCISVMVHRMRKKVAPYGLRFDGVHGPGGGRRMIWRGTK